MQFLNPIALFGFVALAIPVLIHLFNFKRPKRVFFTNVRFLRELKLESKRRSQLKHLLVLLMRLLAFSALILAFAMPVIRKSGDAAVHGKPLIVVCIDNSFSMQSPGEGGMLLEKAVKSAVEIAGYYNPSDEFYLVTNDFSSNYSRIVNKSDFLELVTSVQFSPLSRSAADIFERVEDIGRRNPTRHILLYVISDFQSSTVDITASMPDADWEVFLLPQQQSGPNNLYLDSVWMDIPVIRPGQIVEFRVSVGNTGSSDAEDVPVALSLNGRETAVGTVNVPAAGKAVVNLSARIAEEGIYHGVVTIDDHPVVFDDRFYISTKVSKQRNVLSLYGDKPDPYLEKLFADDSLFSFNSRPATQIDFASLKNYDIIFCNGFKEMSSGLTGSLQSYAEEGGTLVMIPHEDPLAGASVNPLLDALGVATFGLFDTARVRVGSINFDHDLYKSVYSEKPSNLAMPVVYRYFQVTPRGTAGESVIIKMLNDLPLLMSGIAGKGKVYLFATSFSPTSTTLASHAEIFVPPVYNMALYAGSVRPLYYLAGTDRSVNIPYNDGIGQSVFRIRSLDGSQEFIPGNRNEPSGTLLFFEDQISRAGNYQVLLDDAEIAPLAFNYHYNESDLKVDDQKSIQQWIKQEALTNVQIIGSGGKSVTEKLREMNDGVKLWRYFAMAAILFLLIEVLLLRFWRRVPLKTT